MYILEDFGSFHVGGRVVEVKGKEKRTVWFTETTSHEQDPNGKFLIEQLYVQYFIPKEQKFKYPLVLLHGGGLTGACWETTPDGRPGWLNEFLSQGFSVYVIDNVERGRSGFCAVQGIWDGEPIPRTKKEAWDIFRFGAPEGYETGEAFKGQKFPLESIDTFQKQFVPRWTSTSDAQIRGVGAALRKIGPCVLLCHSQGGFLGSRAAIENSEFIRGVVCAEASGWPLLEDITTETIHGKPWLVLLGDFIEQSTRWSEAKKETEIVCNKINSVGGKAELILLPEVGFDGATHMFMMDENSADIADWIGNWIRSSC